MSLERREVIKYLIQRQSFKMLMVDVEPQLSVMPSKLRGQTLVIGIGIIQLCVAVEVETVLPAPIQLS